MIYKITSYDKSKNYKLFISIKYIKFDLYRYNENLTRIFFLYENKVNVI